MAKASKNLTKKLAEIDTMGMHELRALFNEVIGRETKTRNTTFLREHLKKKVSAAIAGGATTLAKPNAKPKPRKRVADETAPTLAAPAPSEAETSSPETRQDTASSEAESKKEKREPKGRHVRADPRLPDVGTTLVRDFKDKRYEVVVIEDGFRYAGERYTSLSTIAKIITGISWNGWSFFKLQPAQKAAAAA